MNAQEILVIDDEEQIQKLLKITLQANDFKVVAALTAREGLRTAGMINPDLVMLDLGLPDENGHEVLKKLREWFTRPIIILSAQSSEENIVKALDNGANDYLVKPFRTGELLARTRAVLRGVVAGNTMKLGPASDLEIDVIQRMVRKNGEPVKLTSTEYDLLCVLIKNEGRVLTHQYLLREVWGPGHIDQSQYLRVYVNQLRKKIEQEPNQPKYILTESGVGYRFISKEDLA